MTPRKLSWMAQGKREENWNHTSHLLSMIHNANPYRKSNLTPDQCNPTGSGSRRRKEPDVQMNLKDLRHILVPNSVQRPPGQLIGGGTTPVKF